MINSKKMSYASIDYRGGLGNQLFNIFALLSYCLDHQKIPVFRYSETSPSITPRKTYWKTLFRELNNFLTVEFDQVIKEVADFQYHPLPFREGNVLLDGYFQCYQYFYHHLEEIKQLLKIPQQQQEVLDLYPLPAYSCAVHFRLGDYKRLSHVNPLLPVSYYRNCASQLKQLTNKPTILYFCEQEDDQYVIEHYLPAFEDFEVIKVPNSLTEEQQLLLISCCDSQVIANSTFSLWGALLAIKNDTKSNVYYPSRWFFQPTSPDMVLPDWHKVDIN